MSERYEVSVAEVLRVVQQLGGLTTGIGDTIGKLAGLAAPAAGYGQIGSAAGAAAGDTQQQLTAALKALEQVLTLLTARVRKSATAYAESDRKVTAEFARLVDELPRIGR